MSDLSDKLNGHSGNDEMRTPAYLWDWLDRRFRFDYDAAASQANHKTRIYSTTDGTFEREGPDRPDILSPSDGLEWSWHGMRVFVNPPYSRPLLGQFVSKAISERDNADIIVMLVKCDTSTENYRLLEQYAHIEHLRRVWYDDENGEPIKNKQGKPVAATFASCLAILRPTEPRPPKK